jgi:hypothetical protein
MVSTIRKAARNGQLFFKINTFINRAVEKMFKLNSIFRANSPC